MKSEPGSPFRRLRRSLKYQLVAVSVCSILISLVSFGGGLYLFERNLFMKSMVSDLSVLAHVLGEQCQAALAFDNREDASAVLASLRANEQVEAAFLYDTKGALFATYLRIGENRSLQPARAPEGFGHDMATEHLTLYRPIKKDGRSFGHIHLVSSTAALHQRLQTFLLSAAVLLLAMLLLSTLLATQLHRAITEPLSQLVATANEVSQTGNFQLRASATAENEVGELVDRFNHMLEEIGKRDADLIASRQQIEKQAVDLARSNEELEQFAYVASHDLQEPLRKVQTFGDWLLEDHSGALDPDGLDYLNRMIEGSRRMQHMIEDILAYSRVSSTPSASESVDLGVVCASVAEDFELKLAELGAQIHIDEGLPTVQGNPTQLTRLVQNLVGNGLKFRREGVPPEIRITRGGSGREVVVDDNGIGFEDKFSDQIFGIFQRLHGRQDYEGTGIGLAECRKIMERHGGSIRAEGRPGEGARFVLNFPAPVPG